MHVYFSTSPVDRNHDRDQLAALDSFRESLADVGLYGTFSTAGDLVQKVRTAIEHDLTGQGLSTPSVAKVLGASLAAHYRYVREPDQSGRLQTSHERIEIVNSGGTLAKRVTISLTSLDEGLATPQTWNDAGPFTMAANGGSFSIALLTHSGTATRV